MNQQNIKGFRAVKLLSVMLYCWIHVVIRLSEPHELCHPTREPACRLWTRWWKLCPCACIRCTTPVRDGGCAKKIKSWFFKVCLEI